MNFSRHEFSEIGSRADPRMPYNLMARSRGLRVTYIPKNMCSTLKLSIQIAEGLAPRESVPAILQSPSFIHEWTFPLEPRHHADTTLPHSVAILRDPYSRLRSTLIEKVITQPDRGFETVVGPILARCMGYFQRAMEEVTFSDIMAALAWLPDRLLDPHWHAQIGFLSGRYDRLLPMEARETVARHFADFGIELFTVDHHATSRGTGEPFYVCADDSALAVRAVIGGRNRPVVFDAVMEEKIRQLVPDRYAHDLELWTSVRQAVGDPPDAR